jgi:NADH-quinone oxidoreductase subunit G
VLENDLYKRASKDKVNKAFEKNRKMIVIDHLMHETAKRADIILPAATYAESSGTIINNERRAQRYYPVLPLNHQVQESWHWIINLMNNIEEKKTISWTRFDDVVASMAHYYPAFSLIRNYIPNAGFRYYNEKIARQTMRFSGRTAIDADVSVSEPKPPADLNTPLNFSMEGYKGQPPANLIPYYWKPGWNSAQAMNKYLDEPDGSVKDMDPGIKLPLNVSDPTLEFISSIPDPFMPSEDKILFFPAHRIFGSEELSSYSQGISKLIPQPYVIINEKGAAKMKNGSMVNLDGVTIKVNVETDHRVPDGIAGLSWLAVGMPYIQLPAMGMLAAEPERNIPTD